MKYFGDKFIFKSERLDSGSKRLGKIFGSSLGLGWSLYLIYLLLDHERNWDIYKISVAATIVVISTCIIPWLSSVIIRSIFWTADGFIAEKEK